MKEVLQLKTDFNSVKMLRSDILNIFETLDAKLSVLKKIYGSFLRVHNQSEYMFGIDSFTAIVNPPDSCILAVGGIKQVPIVKDGEICPGNTMKVTLSCDHRVVDGATGAAFLQTFKGYLENPVTMLL